MAVDPAGFCKVKYVYTDGLGSIFPGMEAKLVGSPSTSNLQDLVDAIGGFWQDRLAALTNPIWTLHQAKLIYSDGTIEHQVVSDVNVVGTLGSTTSSPRSAAVVTGYQISSFFRGGKPRTYWPNLGRYESGSDTRWQSALIGDYGDAVTDLLSDINGYSATGVTSFTLGCIRRVRDHVALDPPEFFAYGAVHADTRICSQRKRLGPL